MVVRKKWRIVWDKVALEDFKESLTFLGSQSLRAPKLVKKEILLHLDHVKKNPWIFEEDRLKSPSDSTFRAFVVFNYRVVYRIIPDSGEIHILRIRHTSREPKEVN